MPKYVNSVDCSPKFLGCRSRSLIHKVRLFNAGRLVTGATDAVVTPLISKWVSLVRVLNDSGSKLSFSSVSSPSIIKDLHTVMQRCHFPPYPHPRDCPESFQLLCIPCKVFITHRLRLFCNTSVYCCCTVNLLYNCLSCHFSLNNNVMIFSPQTFQQRDDRTKTGNLRFCILELQYSRKNNFHQLSSAVTIPRPPYPS